MSEEIIIDHEVETIRKRVFEDDDTVYQEYRKHNYYLRVCSIDRKANTEMIIQALEQLIKDLISGDKVFIQTDRGQQ